MDNQPKRGKRSSSFRLTPEARALLPLIAQRLGVSQSSVLELLIRNQATQLCLPLNSSPSMDSNPAILAPL
jgi:hypothetical protein